MGYQFIHVECYSRSAGAGKAGGRSVADVVAEAERVPSACPHVAHPLAPVLLYGMMPSGAAARADQRAAVARDASGRKFRKDGLCLLGGVASFPELSETVGADAEVRARWAAWETATVAWLGREYGDRLASVVRHEDEGHPHVHFYVIPELGDGDRLRIADVHAGRLAADGAKVNGAAKGDQNAAYKSAMRAYQQRYWEAVGLGHGLTRLGPGRRRLTRAEWQAERVAAAATAEALRAAEAAEGRRAQATAVIERARSVVAAARADVIKARASAETAETARRQAEEAARHQARRILARARDEGGRLLAEAEAKSAPLRRLGGRLGALWSGLRSVEARLVATADARVAAARKAATDEVSRAKTRLRDEARSAVQSDLATLRVAAADAERQLQAAEVRSAKAVEEACKAKAALIEERAARAVAERERERFRSMWADADNAMSALTAPAAGPVHPR